MKNDFASNCRHDDATEDSSALGTCDVTRQRLNGTGGFRVSTPCRVGGRMIYLAESRTRKYDGYLMENAYCPCRMT